MTRRLAVVAALILVIAGWAWAGEPVAAQAAQAAAAAPQAPATTTDAGFFGELAFKDVATAADTARAMVIFVSEGDDKGADFVAAKAYLKDHGVLPDGWLEKAAADAPTNKGHLASLICRALKIKGGVWMRLLGPLPRLALSECVYLEMMAPGSEYCNVSGGELVGTIDRADRLRAKGTAKDVPDIQGEPSGAVEVKKP